MSIEDDIKNAGSKKIEEENRSAAILLSNTVGKTENFKRPNHPDFATTSELKASQFSGIRHNSLTDYMQIWVVGEVRFEMPVREYKLYPRKWEQGYAEVFGLHNVSVEPMKGN